MSSGEYHSQRFQLQRQIFDEEKRASPLPLLLLHRSVSREAAGYETGDAK